MRITELLLHPVRLRIVQAAFDGMPFTTSGLRERLPDVSRATMYRHVEILHQGGLLEVDSEVRVQGATERRYRLRPSRTLIDSDAAAAMSVEDHRHGFAAAVAALLAEFDLYLDRDGADPLADQVSYRQFPLWLTDDEKRSLVAEFVTLIRSRMPNEPGHGRRKHVLGSILFPTDAST